MHKRVSFVDKYPILAVVEEINDCDEATRNWLWQITKSFVLVVDVQTEKVRVFVFLVCLAGVTSLSFQVITEREKEN